MKSNTLVRIALLCLLAPFRGALLAAQQPAWTPELQPEGVEATAAAATEPARPKEDWGNPALDRASLDPLSYAVIGTTETPDFTRELLRVQWRAGDPIDLFVIKPHGVKKPPVILYLYGYPSDTNIYWNDGWCKRATTGGFAAVGFVGALTGQRYMARPMKQWFVSELQESLGKTAHDVQMILDYLGSRDDLDAGQVGMFGQGSGGAIAILAAQADPRIVALDVLDPWGDWPDWLRSSPQVPEDERAAYLKPEFLERVANLDPVLFLPHLKVKALRVEQLMSEPVTPPAAKMRIGGAVPRSSELLRYNDEVAHLKEWRVNGLSGWLRGQMHPLLACTPAGSNKEGQTAAVSGSGTACGAVRANP